MLFVKLVFSVILIIGIINPKAAWKVSEGWKFKNVEPSETYLMLNRIASVIFLIILWAAIPN